MKKIFQKNSKKEQKWSLEEEFQPEAYEIEQFKPSAEASPEAYGLMESWLTERSASALSSKNSILKITNAYDITADLINTAQKSQNNRKVSFLEEELPEIRPAFINDADLISVNSGDEQWSPNGENAKRSSTYPPASAVKTSLESLEKIRDLDYLIQSPTNDFLEIPSPLDGEIEILFPTEAVPSPISLPNNDCEQTEAQSDSTSSNWLDRDTSSEGLNQVPVSSSKGNSTIVTSSSEEGAATHNNSTAIHPTNTLESSQGVSSVTTSLFFDRSSIMLNKPLPPPPIPQSQLPNPPLNLNNSPSTSNQYSEHSFYEQTSGKNSQNVEEVLGQKSISRSNSGSNFGNFGSVSSECNNFAVPGSSESDFVQISGSTTVLDRQDSVKSDSSTAKSIKLGLKSDTLSPSAAFGLTPSEDDAMQWRKSSIQSSVMFEVGEMNKQNNNTDSDSIDYGSDDDELPLSIVSSRLHCESESHDSSEPLTPRDSKPRLDFHKAETSEEEEGSSVTTPVEMPNNLPANVSPFKDEMNRNTSAATKHIVPEAVTGLKALSGSQSPPPRPHSALSVKEKTPRAELKIDSTSLSGEILKSLSPDLQDLPLNYDVIPRPASAPSGLISKRDKSHSLNVMVADKQFRSVRTTKILLDKNEHSSPPAVHSTDSYLLRRPNSSRPILMGSRPYSMLSSRDSSRSVGNVSRKLGESVTEDGLNEHKSSGKVQSNKLPREMDNISAISKVQEQNDMADAEEGTHRSLDLSVQSENLLTSVKEYQPFAPASMARVKELQKTENGYQKIRNSYPSAASSNYQAKAEVSSNFSGNRPSSEYASRPNTLPEVPPSHYEPPHPMPAYDPRFLPGHDPRFMPAYYPGYDPRFWPGYDPRILSGHDPRSMPGFDSRQYSPLSSPQPYPRDSYSNQPNLTHQSMADYYYGVTSATAAAPERQPSYVPPHFQSIRSQPHSASYSSSLAGYPIEPPIILKKTIPLAIPARNSSLHLSPALKRNSMALNNRGNENS